MSAANMLNAVLDKSPTTFADEFENVIRDKVSAAIENKKLEFAAALYGESATEDEDFDDTADVEPTEDEDFDLDDEDFDLDDDDLEYDDDDFDDFDDEDFDDVGTNADDEE